MNPKLISAKDLDRATFAKKEAILMNPKKLLAAGIVLVIGLAPGLPAQAQSGPANPIAQGSPPDDAGEIVVPADFNGDGLADLAVGVPGENIDGNSDAGAVNVLYGSAGGLSAAGDQFWHQNVTDVDGVSNPDDNFGWALATGDFDGNGFTDLAVGVPGENVDGNANAGAVNVLYGSVGGLSAAGDQLWNQNSPDVEGVANVDDQFGYALAAGDFDGDGFDDLAIGVPFADLADILLPHLTDAGAVNVLYGTATGLSAVGDQLVDPFGWALGDPAELFDNFGWSLAAANFGNGSQADLAVGIPGEDVGANADAGAVNVIYGTSAGLSAAGAQFWNQDTTDVEGGSNPGDNFGWALAATNFGNDVRADLAIGVPNENIDGNADAGAVNVLYGTTAGLSAAGDQFWHQNVTDVEGAANPGDQFGWALAAANFGVTNQADLAIGVPNENIGGNADAGAVNVLYGTTTGLSAAGDQFWSQNTANVEGDPNPSDQFGWSLAAGNFGKTPQADLAVGVPNEDVGAMADAGAVNLLYGSGAVGLCVAGDQLWNQDSTDVEGVANPGDTFGWALAAGR